MNETLVIAEIGVNHNGDVGLAREMIAAAKATGVDIVKFQTYKAEEVMTDQTPSLVRLCPNCRSERPVSELYCENDFDGRPCNWALADEPLRRVGGSAAPQVRRSRQTRRKGVMHRVAVQVEPLFERIRILSRRRGAAERGRGESRRQAPLAVA